MLFLGDIAYVLADVFLTGLFGGSGKQTSGNCERCQERDAEAPRRLCAVCIGRMQRAYRAGAVFCFAMTALALGVYAVVVTRNFRALGTTGALIGLAITLVFATITALGGLKLRATARLVTEARRPITG